MSAHEKPSSLIDSIIDGIGDAVADVRDKVILEPFFGDIARSNGADHHPRRESPYAAHGLPASFAEYREMQDTPQKEPEKQATVEIER